MSGRITWTEEWLKVAADISLKSTCLSIQRGCVIVLDNILVSSGYNGPPSNFPHCDTTEHREMLLSTTNIRDVYYGINQKLLGAEFRNIFLTHLNVCPRKLIGFRSGEGLDFCSAAHCETNAISLAAKIGRSVNNGIMYCNFHDISCRECAKLIKNAGIKKVVLADEPRIYLQPGITGAQILKASNVEVINGQREIERERRESYTTRASSKEC
jgi:dCMP deaminase